MKKYRLMQNTNHLEIKEYKKNKSKFKKIKLSSGIVAVSLAVFTITKPQTFVNNIQYITYAVNEIFTDSNDIENLDSKTLKEIQEFENKLSENIPLEYLKNYYNNIRDLKYYNNPNDLKKFWGTKGYYSIKANRMVNIFSQKHIKFHELMHMASSNNKYSGFSDGKTAIGITEGYTEYLVLKLFEDDIETMFAYSKEIEVIEVLNKIIGEDKMMKYYFTNDLESLKNDLCNIWGTEKDVDKLIENIDIYTTKKEYRKLDDIGRSLIKYSYLSEIKKNNSLTIDKKFKYLLDGLHYKYDFKELENEVLDEIYNELNINKIKVTIDFVEKNDNTKK